MCECGDSHLGSSNLFPPTEYFQWSPTHNENSASHNVNPGDVLYGSVTFDPKQQGEACAAA